MGSKDLWPSLWPLGDRLGTPGAHSSQGALCHPQRHPMIHLGAICDDWGRHLPALPHSGLLTAPDKLISWSQASRSSQCSGSTCALSRRVRPQGMLSVWPQLPPEQSRVSNVRRWRLQPQLKQVVVGRRPSARAAHSARSTKSALTRPSLFMLLQMQGAYAARLDAGYVLILSYRR